MFFELLMNFCFASEDQYQWKPDTIRFKEVLQYGWALDENNLYLLSNPSLEIDGKNQKEAQEKYKTIKCFDEITEDKWQQDEVFVKNVPGWEQPVAPVMYLNYQFSNQDQKISLDLMGLSMKNVFIKHRSEEKISIADLFFNRPINLHLFFPFYENQMSFAIQNFLHDGNQRFYSVNQNISYATIPEKDSNGKAYYNTTFLGIYAVYNSHANPGSPAMQKFAKNGREATNKSNNIFSSMLQRNIWGEKESLATTAEKRLAKY